MFLVKLGDCSVTNYCFSNPLLPHQIKMRHGEAPKSNSRPWFCVNFNQIEALSSFIHVGTLHLYLPNFFNADWGSLVDVVGYCFLNLGSRYQPQEEFVQWIQKGDKPIYIGFGSMVWWSYFKLLVKGFMICASCWFLCNRGFSPWVWWSSKPVNLYILGKLNC